MTTATPTRRRLDGGFATVWAGTKQSALSAGIGFIAILTAIFVVFTAVTCLVGVGLLLVRPAVLLLRVVADLERRRLVKAGADVPSPYHELPPGVRLRLADALGDLTVRRDLGWLLWQSTAGFIIALFVLQMPISIVRETSLPLWWWMIPANEPIALNGFVYVHTWGGAFLAALAGPAWLVIWVLVCERTMRLLDRIGTGMLSPHPDIDLSARVAQLTATRAAALDAHAVELRRIERALHDGAQNRLVGVAVLVGAARQAMRQDPSRAEAILDKVQSSAEEALAELRSVVRSILPPVLEDRGLTGALSALASECPVPCELSVEVAVRCPASVEATAYFTVAEALTNVAKHSRASRCKVDVVRSGDRLTVTVSDNGRGGADSATGSGIAGIGRRVAAHDGRIAVTSPAGGPTIMEVELPCGS